MNRRTFLSGLLGLIATAELDPEMLLWRPTKTIFMPPATEYSMQCVCYKKEALDRLMKRFMFTEPIVDIVPFGTGKTI